MVGYQRFIQWVTTGYALESIPHKRTNDISEIKLPIQNTVIPFF